jgi:acetyl-CoA C-acetyltransferase
MSRILPVLIGAGQTTDRPDDPTLGKEPLALMEEAARGAVEDAGDGRALLAALDTVAVVTNVFHDYGDTAALLAERLACRPARTLVTTWGGNTPQSLMNHLCDEIAAGRSELALMAGAEAVATVRALGKAGKQAAWTPPRPTDAPRWGDPRPGMSDLESRHGAREPLATYAMVENAFRAARGLSLAEHRAELGEFCARCTQVAARNPHAWFRDAKDATTIVTVTAGNRMVAFPYPKFMNAILEVNQGAALLLASDGAVRRLGIRPDRCVFPWAGVDVNELWFLTDRVNYHTLPGMQRAARELLTTAGVGLDEIRHLDLYSCFPIAPRLSAAMLGLAPDAARPLTVAGGLPWFGGPGNNYTTHAIAAVMERLRADRDAFALTHALGWNLTKHALAIYAGTPPPSGWQRAGGAALQAWVDALPHPALVPEATGRGTIETYTVVHGHDGGPERGVVIGRLDDHRRFIAAVARDRALLESMERAEQIGRAGTVRHDGERNVFFPA